MPQPEDPTIERTTDLDIDVDALWELISTAQGWNAWLVDNADVAIERGGSGTATNDGVQRDVRIETITDRCSVDFAWWDHDDPTSASYVQLGIVELPGGRSRLHVTERFAGASRRARAAIDTAIDTSIGVTWDVRFVSLWMLALHCTVMA
ncbi:MAG: hypothetical protein ABI949_05725 [Ilumatobacteraceae bacterium]